MESRRAVRPGGQLGTWVFPFPGPATVPEDGVLFLTAQVSGIDRMPSRLSVSLHLRHENVGRLGLILVGPDGKGVLLSIFHGEGADSYGVSCDSPVVFDDRARLAIEDARPPFVGDFRPQEPLATHLRKPLAAFNGPWHLIVSHAGRGSSRPHIPCAALVMHL